MAKEYDNEAWLRDPVLSKRSITPPRSMTRESVGIEGALSFVTMRARLTARTVELQDLKKQLLTANLARHTALPDIIKQIDSELIDYQSRFDTLAPKYDQAVLAYNLALASATFSDHVLCKEKYTISINSAGLEVAVSHYRINNLIPITVDTSTVFDVSTVEMTEDGIKSPASDAASRVSSASGSTKTPKKAILLHPLEIDLLKTAICNLVKVEDEKAILLDIFDKDETGSVKKNVEGKFETHTIVLYKHVYNGSTQVFVIDPNNSTFSKHLDNPIFKAFINSVTPHELGWIDIIASQKPIKIYTSPEGASLGPESTSFRDCEDLAVKIAVWLNRPEVVISQNLSFDSKDFCVTDLPIIQALSNMSETNKDLALRHKDLPLRGRQSSMQETIIEISRLEKFIKTQKDLLLAAKKTTLIQKAQNNHISALETASLDIDAEKYLQTLKQVITFNVGLISDPSVGFVDIVGVTEAEGGGTDG